MPWVSFYSLASPEQVPGVSVELMTRVLKKPGKYGSSEDLILCRVVAAEDDCVGVTVTCCWRGGWLSLGQQCRCDRSLDLGVKCRAFNLSLVLCGM